MSTRKKIAGWILAVCLGLGLTVKAADIALYTFTGSNASPASVISGVNATSLGLSAGTLDYGSSQATTWTNFPPNSGVPYAEESAGWTANSQASAKNFRFSITNNGANFTVTNISFETRATSAGPSTFGVSINGSSVYSAPTLTQDVTLAVNLPITGFDNLVGATIAIQGWTNGTRATAGSGAFRVDTILVQGIVDAVVNPPEVIVTTADNTVPTDTNTYDIAGTANANTVGELTWTNTFAGVGGTIAVAANWSIPGISISVGTNVITVRGTNDAGASSQDSVTIIRQASPPPSVVITTPSQIVPNATTSIDVDGTSNADTVGQLHWTNALTGASGAIAAALSWTVPGVALDVGANLITVRGSNTFGSLTQASITVTREQLLPTLGTNTQFFQGFEPGDSWTITDGGSFISADVGATDTPANSRIRTGANSWQSIGSSTNSLDLAEVNITGKTNVAIRVRLASLSGTTGNGADIGDFVRFAVALDGSAFGDPELAVRGNSNARWDFGALLTAHRIVDGSATVTNGAPQGATSSNNYATVILYIPSGATSVALRVTAGNSDANEIWALDDIELLSSDAGGGPGPIIPVEQEIIIFQVIGGTPTLRLGGSQVGVNYAFRYTTSLSSPQTWTQIGAATPGTGSELDFFDPSATDASRLYQVDAIAP